MSTQTNPLLAEAQANALLSSRVDTLNMNANLKAWYLNGFANWALSITTGKTQDNSNPPQPPLGYTVEIDDAGWAHVVPGSDPVCAMPAVPKPSGIAPAAPPQGHESTMGPPATVTNVPPGDLYPLGHILTGVALGFEPESIWQKGANPTPFGEAYFYQRIQ
jgi:hypothetical protein